MNFNINGLLLFLLCLTSLSAIGQTKTHNKQIESYFEQRIENGHAENQLIPYTNKKGLTTKNWQSAKSDVWAIWKTVNNRMEQLPTLVQATAEMPTNQWELIGEEPMPFYYFKKGAAGTNKAPLFLNLHGSGPKAMEFKNTAAWALRYQDSPSIYFIPQIPSERRYRWWLKPVQYAWERMFRLAMLDEQIDPNKIFITGISEGGYGSQRLGAFYADYLAGIGPMAGGEPLRNAPPVNFKHIAFSLQTGENDRMFGRNTLTKAAKDTFDILEAKYPGSYKHQVIIQAGKGHGIDYTTTTPWLVKFTRNATPTDLHFVFFPMDGRYRKTFYNIALNNPMKLKEGDKKDRVIFDVKFNQNTVTVETYVADAELKDKCLYDDFDFSIFLDDRYVDLNKKVKLIYNGRQILNKKLKLDEASLVESTALFADPERVFPVKLSVEAKRK